MNGLMNFAVKKNLPNTLEVLTMGGFYSSDKRIMGWIDCWIKNGIDRHFTYVYRGMLAAQLRIIRKKHGTLLARGYRDHMLWIGSYPTR